VDQSGDRFQVGIHAYRLLGFVAREAGCGRNCDFRKVDEKTLGLQGGLGHDFNHAKIGVLPGLTPFSAT